MTIALDTALNPNNHPPYCLRYINVTYTFLTVDKLHVASLF